jgi:hypothetical protein
MSVLTTRDIDAQEKWSSKGEVQALLLKQDGSQTDCTTVSRQMDFSLPISFRRV